MTTFNVQFAFRSVSQFTNAFVLKFGKISAAAIVVCSCLTAPAVSAAKNMAPQSAVTHARVNINSADAETLASIIKGVGLKKAQAIVDWRKAHGEFKSLEDLALVKGIGESTVEKNRSKLTL